MNHGISAITLGELGAFFGGIAALITILWTIGLSIAKKWIHRGIATTMNEMVQARLLKTAAAHDPASYYTLDVVFSNGDALAVPMFPFAEVMIADHLWISVIDHDTDETTLQIRSTGYTMISPHRHDHTTEVIEVKRGWVTHLETGHIYRSGETWNIAQGEVHSATFSDNFKAYCRHRPPLPTAKERPVNLDGFPK